MRARIIASLILGAPSLAAIYGSAASLVEIAAEERLSDPRVLPFCLDILAVSIVVSAVFCGHDDRLSRLTPWAAYGASATLQVAEAWHQGPRGWAVHALPLAAGILGTEMILRLWRPAANLAGVTGAVPDEVRSAHLVGTPGATVEPGRPAPPPEPAAIAEVARPVRTGRRRAALQAPRGATWDDLLRLAGRLAEREGTSAADLSQRTLKSELGIGTDRARELPGALKRPSLELVDAADR
jgi:hypothetical protein